MTDRLCKNVRPRILPVKSSSTRQQKGVEGAFATLTDYSEESPQGDKETDSNVNRASNGRRLGLWYLVLSRMGSFDY